MHGYDAYPVRCTLAAGHDSKHSGWFQGKPCEWQQDPSAARAIPPVDPTLSADDVERLWKQVDSTSYGWKGTLKPLFDDWYRLRAALAAATAQAEAARRGLNFAASVIKSGEPWTEECDRMIGEPLRFAARSGGHDESLREKHERDPDDWRGRTPFPEDRSGGPVSEKGEQ